MFLPFFLMKWIKSKSSKRNEPRWVSVSFKLCLKWPLFSWTRRVSGRASLPQDRLKSDQQVWIEGTWWGLRGPRGTLMWQEARAQCSPPMFWKSKWVFYSHFLPSFWTLLNLYVAESNYSFSPSFSRQLEKVKIVLLSCILKLLFPGFCSYLLLKNVIRTIYWCTAERESWVQSVPRVSALLCRRSDTSMNDSGEAVIPVTLPGRWGGLPVLKTSWLNFRMTDSASPPPPQLICPPTVQGDGIKIWGLWGD